MTSQTAAPSDHEIEPCADAGIARLIGMLPAQGFAIAPTDIERLGIAFPPGRRLSRRATLGLLKAILTKDQGQRDELEVLFRRMIRAVPSIQPRVAEASQPAQPAESTERSATGATVTALPGATKAESGTEVAATLTLPAPQCSYARHLIFQRTAIGALMLLILALVSASVALLFWFLEYAPFAIDVPTDATVKPKSNMSTLMLSWFAAISLVVSSIVGVFFVLRGNFSLRLSPGSAPAVNDHGEPGFAWAPEETGPAPVLDAGERRAIRWGIGKVQTDRTLCLLNVPRTVNESARAGYPMPRFQRLRMDREIWLWRDRRVDHEAALTLFEELRTDLGRSGLPLRLGFFNGLPRHIEMDGRAEVDCFNLEYTGREAIVLVLTDGAGLVELAGSHQGRKRLERLVRDLSAWPRLTLVDFSTPDLDLAGLARSLGLNCVAPTQLARWMTEQPLIPSSARTGSEMAVDTLGGDAELLAALCALGPERPITPRQIAALSQAIGGSGVRPPRLPGARECATGVLLDAATRQNLLARLGVHGCDPKWAPRLAQARGFWRDRLEASNSAEVDMESGSDIRSVGASGLRPWLNSPGQHMLRVESLLLGLWDQGEAPQSAKDLHRLFQIPRLGKLIQRRLAKLDAAGIAEPYGARISLPWAWADLRELPGEPSGSTRWRLYQMGFAGRQLETGSRDITARIVLGLLIGIALAGFVGVIRVLLSFSQ